MFVRHITFAETQDGQGLAWMDRRGPKTQAQDEFRPVAAGADGESCAHGWMEFQSTTGPMDLMSTDREICAPGSMETFHHTAGQKHL